MRSASRARAARRSRARSRPDAVRMRRSSRSIGTYAPVGRCVRTRRSRPVGRFVSPARPRPCSRRRTAAARPARRAAASDALPRPAPRRTMRQAAATPAPRSSGVHDRASTPDAAAPAGRCRFMARAGADVARPRASRRRTAAARRRSRRRRWRSARTRPAASPRAGRGRARRRTHRPRRGRTRPRRAAPSRPRARSAVATSTPSPPCLTTASVAAAREQRVGGAPAGSLVPTATRHSSRLPTAVPARVERRADDRARLGLVAPERRPVVEVEDGRGAVAVAHQRERGAARGLGATAPRR